MEQLRIGIVGTGRIVQVHHLPNWAKIPQAKVVAVSDVAPGRARQVADQHDIPYSFEDYRELVAHPEVDAVQVCAPNFLHAPITLAALKAGKHVLCEKPLATTVAAAQEMVETARQVGRTLMVGLNNRFRTDVRVLRRHIEAGDLGDIYYVKCGWLRRRGNPFGWFADTSKSGGGPLIDLGVHVIDLARYLMGKPKAITVTGSTYRNIGAYDVKDWTQYSAMDAKGGPQRFSDVEDMASAFIRFDNGATLVVDVSWALNIKQDVNYYEVYGTKGGAKLNPLEIATEYHGHLADLTPAYKEVMPAHEGELRHFVESVLSGQEPICPGEDGLAMAQILEAIYESARTGREVCLEGQGGASHAAN